MELGGRVAFVRRAAERATSKVADRSYGACNAGVLALAVMHECSLEEVEEVITPITGTPTSG